MNSNASKASDEQDALAEGADAGGHHDVPKRTVDPHRVPDGDFADDGTASNEFALVSNEIVAGFIPSQCTPSGREALKAADDAVIGAKLAVKDATEALQAAIDKQSADLGHPDPLDDSEGCKKIVHAAKKAWHAAKKAWHAAKARRTGIKAVRVAKAALTGAKKAVHTAHLATNRAGPTADPTDPKSFQILDIIGWQQTGGKAADLGWLLKSEQAEAVARMRSLQRYGIAVGALAVTLTVAAAVLAVASWCVVRERTGIGCENHEFFIIPDALWEYSVSSASAVLLCLAAATLLFRVAQTLFADASAAFATSDAARRAEASVRFLRLAETVDPVTDGKIRDGMIALGLEFGRRNPNAQSTPTEISSQVGELLDVLEKVKNLSKKE